MVTINHAVRNLFPVSFFLNSCPDVTLTPSPNTVTDTDTIPVSDTDTDTNTVSTEV
jgi:hypothetical protein